MKRRAFLMLVLAAVPIIAEARGRRGGMRYRSAGSASGGSSGGCGSRGGPGYRKANGKCASWRN